MDYLLVSSHNMKFNVGASLDLTKMKIQLKFKLQTILSTLNGDTFTKNKMK